MAKKKKRVKVKLIKVKPLRGKIFNSQNLNKLKNFGKYFVFLFLLSPLSAFADTLSYTHSFTASSAIYGSGAYWENDQAGQYIDCNTIGNGTITRIGVALGTQARDVTVRFDVGDDIEAYYSITNQGILIPANTSVQETIITLDTPYDCTIEQGLYISITPEAIADGYGLLIGHSTGNAYVCNNGNTNCESWGPVGWNSVDRDIGFTIYTQDETPTPPDEMSTAMVNGLNLILIAMFLSSAGLLFSSKAFTK